MIEITNISTISTNHPNLTKTFGFCFDFKKNFGYNLMELIEFNLRDLIYDKKKFVIGDKNCKINLLKNKIDENGKLKLNEKLKIILGIIDGLIYLINENNILHRDIKTDNILIKIDKLNETKSEEDYEIIPKIW
jgi:serine/threonine protein kinase